MPRCRYVREAENGSIIGITCDTPHKKAIGGVQGGEISNIMDGAKAQSTSFETI